MHTAEKTAVIKYPIVPKIIFAVLCVGALYLPFVHSNKLALLNVQEALPALLVPAPILLVLVFMLSTWAEISGDLLFVHLGFFKWQLRRQDIASYFTYTVRVNFQTVHILVLVPKDPGQKQRKVGQWILREQAFKNWLKNIPKGRPQTARKTASVRKQAYDENTTRENLQWIIYGIYAAYLLIALWYVFGPSGTKWVALLAFLAPPLILVLEHRYPQHIRLYQTDENIDIDTRLPTALVFYIPSILIPLLIFRQTHLHYTDPHRFWLYVLALALISFLYVRGRLSALKSGSDLTASIAVCALGYAFALISWGNYLPDKAPLSEILTHVQRLHVIHDKDGPLYEVSVTPQDRRISEITFHVDAATYKRLHSGEKLYIRVHPGALGLRWYNLGS